MEPPLGNIAAVVQNATRQREPEETMLRVAIATTVAFRPTALKRISVERRKQWSEYTGNAQAVERLVQKAADLSRGLEALGSTLDRVAITAYLDEPRKRFLSSAGWCVRDYSAKGDRGVDMRHFARPLFSAEEAAAAGRPWSCNTKVQPRADMAATLYKFVAWTLTSYDRILHADADVHFLARPDPLVTRFDAPYFASSNPHEQSGRVSYFGFNSHMILLPPSASVFHELLRTAKSGTVFVTFTNTEQDILDWMFAPKSQDASFFPDHVHQNALRPKDSGGGGSLADPGNVTWRGCLGSETLPPY